MVLLRQQLLGSPHCYYLHGKCALGQPCLASDEDSTAFLELLDTIRRVYNCHIYAWALQDSAYHLVLRHSPQVLDTDQQLRQRWSWIGGSKTIAIDRLRQRMGNLSGLMQSLTQRFASGYHQRHGSQGHLWAGRYRACLLADDAATMVASAWVEQFDRSSRLARVPGSDQTPQLARLPLRELPGGLVLPADESQLGLPPPLAEQEPVLFESFCIMLADQLPAYDHALQHGWALGRPESLIEPMDRLGRSTGRGRSREVRELEDELGLCGIWG